MSKCTMIVPCYNVEKYIEKCLNSLLNQTYSDFEILVINDGSTDSSREIVERIQKENPDKIRLVNKENGGIADTRNRALSLVNTEYFGFLDGDDTLECHMLEKMMAKAVETQSEVTVCGFTWVYEGNEKKNTITLEGPYEPGKKMIIGLFATLWNKIYRTEFIKSLQLSFPTGYRYEDASFLYRLGPHVKKVAFVEEPLVNYVQRTGSITHTHNEKVKDMIHVFEEIYNYYDKNEWMNEYHDELEYIFIRFFLGNSFLRTVQIPDKQDRELTLELSWKILEERFPAWKKNPYLRQPGLKNVYYRMINRTNYNLFAHLFTVIKK